MNLDCVTLLEKLGAENISERHGEVWASCPMPNHDDSTPSFAMRNDPGGESHCYWVCYGCHAKGGPIGLVRQILKLGPREARAYLSNIQSSASIERLTRVSGLELIPTRVKLGLPPEFQTGPLEQWPTPLRRYAGRRSLDDTQIERWAIGYATVGRYAMRLIVPIHDQSGRLLSFSARTVVGDPARYLSPSKSSGRRLGAIFGRYHWPPDCSDRTVFLAEGAIDALALERAGAECVAALDGSFVDPVAVFLLERFCRIVVVTDTDDSGEGAVKQLEEISRLRSKLVRRSLPAGLDPDEAWIRDPELLLNLVEEFESVT